MYTADRWEGDGSVQSLGDINADGFDDQLVDVGLYYAGANSEWAIVSTDGTVCQALLVGTMSGAGVVADTETIYTNGYLDLLATSVLNCDLGETRYTFDGAAYVEGASTASTLDGCE